MQSRVKLAFAAGALVLATGVGFTVGRADAPQPHMQNALADLKLAQGELQVALHNKGGHRANALNLVNQAITETQAGIAVGDGD